MNKPNIILYHLESLNYLHFSYFRDYLPNLTKLLSESVFYNQYYSSATSTVMTITDLIFQNTTTFENSAYLEDVFSIDFSTDYRLTDFMSARGYSVKISYYENNADLDESSFEKFCNIIADNPDNFFADSMEELLDDFSNYIPKSSPFFFYVQNLESHIGQISYINTNYEISNRQLYLERYVALDNSIGKLIQMLQDMKLYRNTCIILYGDHGDELWGHGLHHGYMHAYEPYNNMIHCPLIVHYNGQTKSCLNESLVSTIDIASIIMNIVDPNIILKKNDVVYSRNLFARQKNNVNIFNKAYSITDGKYILMVTQQGLKMYFNYMDPFSSRNLLDFFIISDSSIRYKVIFNYLSSSHYKSFMTMEQIDEILKSFVFLRQKLNEFVDTTYNHTKSEMQFNKIAYSMDINKSIRYIFVSIFFTFLKKIKRKLFYVLNRGY